MYNKDLPEITDQKLTEKIVGDWKVDSRKLFYRVYSYKKDRTYEINFWLNKHKTVNILTAKGKWKIKNRLLLITIDKVESEHNQSVKVVFNPEIITIRSVQAIRGSYLFQVINLAHYKPICYCW